MAEYRVQQYLEDGSISPQYKFGLMRSKIQIFGGGYGNGKTAAAVVQKVLTVAHYYPGANILVARSTYPKLNDTIRKEFLKWCPKKWIKSFPLSKNSDNTCTLTNGSTINFRYIAQQGKSSSEGEQTTSNLLSATYDLIVIDQLEDPEIVEKDFTDLLGRLRGNAKYIGEDSTMPTTGPRWLVACVNPTRNWVYRRLIAPLKKFQQTGVIDDQLLCRRHPRNSEFVDQPILDQDGRPYLLIDLCEGSTYTNAHNLGSDFIETLESSYQGQSRDRFLYGEWAAYEGLVHSAFSEISHTIPQSEIITHITNMLNRGILPRWIEGYDWGNVVPSCYILGFVDRQKNIILVDGFYEPMQKCGLIEQQQRIHTIREEWGVDPSNVIRADPGIFKRNQIAKNQNAKSIAQLFNEGSHAVSMRPADNAIDAGLVKVNTYLSIKRHHRHPISGLIEAPNLYVAQELSFIINEFNSYYWQTASDGSRTDKPIEKNDHAMNTIKYMIAREPDLALRTPKPQARRHLTHWMEVDDSEKVGAHRYG